MKQNNNNSEGGTGAFNMAVATLMRIDSILKEIKDLSFQPINSGTKQKVKIELVKNLWLNSAPLLKKDNHEPFTWILDQTPMYEFELDNIGRRTGGKRFFFSQELEIKLDKAVLDIEMGLQEEGDYLMAGKNDLRFSWKAD